MTTDSLQNLSSDIIVISIALLGAIFVLIAITWKKFILRISRLSVYWRIQHVKVILFTFVIPLLIPLAVYTAVGVYYPTLAQDSLFLVMMLIAGILILFCLVQGIKWIINRIRSARKEIKAKLEGDTLICIQSLFSLGLSALCSLLALIGCSSSALDIYTGKYQMENFNWSRWLINDAILLFVVGAIQTGILYAMDSRHRNN